MVLYDFHNIWFLDGQVTAACKIASNECREVVKSIKKFTTERQMCAVPLIRSREEDVKENITMCIEN